MTITLLRAFNGDSILISFNTEDGNKNILIDGGTSATYYDSNTNSYGELKVYIERIRAKGELIDLLILTHIDDDHICGLLKWFEMDETAYKLIKNVWFNSGKLIAEFLKEPENPDLNVGLQIFKTAETGVREAIAFENYLLDKKIWDKKVVLKGQEVKQGGVEIQLLSPDATQLSKLLREYKTRTRDAAYTTGRESDWSKSIKELIKEEQSGNFKFTYDSSPKNGSSITFLLTIGDKKFLFLADAHPKGIVESLKELGFSKEKPVYVELVKLAHHGSKYNTSNELLELIKTDNYLISTNSSGHGHPDKKTLARVIHSNPNAVFHFNYEHVRKALFSEQDRNDYNIKARVTSEFTF